MSDYEHFKQSVVKFREASMQLEAKNKEVQTLRTTKRTTEEAIVDYLTRNNALSKPIKLSKDGSEQIVATEKREYGTLSFSYVEECLEKLFDDETEIDRIMTFLHENRSVKETVTLKHIKQDKS
jgi:hypothetical protein